MLMIYYKLYQRICSYIFGNYIYYQGSAEDKARAGSVVGLSVNLACLLSVLIQPFMPQLSAELQSQLAAPDAVNFIPEAMYILLPPGHK